MGSHKHGGNGPHYKGDSPADCPIGGRITYCGPDPDDVFDPQYYCEHEDTASAAGGPLNPPPNSVVGRVGEPEAWTKWSRIPGTPPGMLRIRYVSDNWFDRAPFDSANIPCNPDQVGSVLRTKTETFTVKVSASLTGEVVTAVKATVGIDLTSTVTVTLGESVYGEKCRSVEYRWFVRYKLYELQYAPPNSTAGITLVRFFVPYASPWKRKDYVEPTCCTRRTAALFDRVGGMSGGEARYALATAGDELLVAHAFLVAPETHGEALAAYRRCVEALEEAGSLGAEAAPIIDGVLWIARELATATVSDAAELRTQAGVAGIVSERVDETLGVAQSKLAKAERAAEGSDAAASFARAYEGALAAKLAIERSMLFLDIRSLGKTISSPKDGRRPKN